MAAIFDIGTGNYPEKVGRRLRATTVTAWLIALSMLLFMFASPGKPHPVTLIVLIGSACVPLLHRFGPTVGPLVLIGLAWLHAIRVILTIGTGDGIFLGFLSAAPLSILLFGIERLWIAGALSVLSTGICIYLFHIMPPDTGVNPAEIMRWQFTINYVLNAAVLFCVVAYVVRTAARAEEAVEEERRRSDALLANILPPSIALRLKAAPQEMIADRYDAVSVLFADMAGSTAMASRIDPSVLVDFLNRIFTLIDDLVARYGLEKIKTTGDSYMVVSGIPEPRPDHASVLAALALDMREAISCLTGPDGSDVPVRIGIASGPVVAGVVGRQKFFYDVWGDTVNVAARMEQTGQPGQIQIDSETRRLIGSRYRCETRGSVDIHGKGTMETWFLTGLIGECPQA